MPRGLFKDSPMVISPGCHLWGMSNNNNLGVLGQASQTFAHFISYCATDVPESDVAGYCDYGRRFAAAVTRDNVFAVQFHPEKSADAGLTLLENFLRWQP